MVRFLTRSLVLAFLCVGAGSACAPEAGLDGGAGLTGTVVDAGGAPVPGASVQVRAPLAPQEIDSSRLSELDGVGFACIDERPPPACADHRSSTTTGEQGEFSIGLGSSDVLGADPAVITAPQPITVSVRLDAGSDELSGPAVSRQVAPAADDTEIGTVTVWSPRLELTTVEGGDAVLRWMPAPGPVTGYEVFVEASDGRLVWQETTGAGELRLGLANLAGSRGAVSVVALAKDAPEHWRSARIPYRADEGAVRLATAGGVGWPEGSDLSSGVVLTAIVFVFFTNLLLVVVAGARHRRHLALVPRRWSPARWTAR